MSKQVETFVVDGVVSKPTFEAVKVKGQEKLWYISSKAKDPNGADLVADHFKKGQSYSAVIYTSDKGAKYINSLVNNAANNVEVHSDSNIKSPVLITPSTSDRIEPKEYDRMTKQEWSAKDQRISKQGFLQAAFSAVVAGGYKPTIDEARALAIETAKVFYKEVWGEQWDA